MKKTKLMEIAEKYGDAGAGALNPRTIDGVIYQITSLAEHAFGPSFVSQLEEDISLTESSFPRKDALGFLAGEFITRYLAVALQDKNISFAGNLRSLPKLDDLTYVDYFSAFTTFERHVFRTQLEKACVGVPHILTGYTTETSLPVCEGIVKFFKETKNDLGCFMLIKSLCDKIKHESKIN
jgi:hypothetical protein